MTGAGRILAWLGAYALLSAFVFLPTTLHPADYKFGGFAISDSLDTIYRLWAEQAVVSDDGKGGLRNPIVGAPEGVPFASVVHPVWWLARIATRAGGAVFAYNAAVFASFVLAGLFAHMLVRRASGSEPAAFFAGVAFAFSPFHVLQAGDHIHLAQTWVVPLYFLALYFDLERRSLGSAVWICAAYGVAVWVHPYYGAFLGIATVAVFGYGLLRGQLSRQRGELVRLSALLGGLGGIALLALSALSIVDAGGERSGLVERPLAHLEMLGVRWYEWLLPPFYSLLFGEPVRDFLATRTHGSSAAEMTVFLGFVPLGLAALYLVTRARVPAASWRSRDVFVHWLVVAGVLGLLLSTRPIVELFGVEVTMPSAWLYEGLPMLRAISRWAVLPILSVSCLAAFGIAKATANWAPEKAWILSSVLAGAVMLEFSPVHASLYLDTRRVPPVYDALRELPGDALVLELPVTALNDFIPYFWQMHHGRCLFNVPGESNAHTEQVLAFQASDLAGIVVRAQRLGIDHVVIHSEAALPFGRSFRPTPGADAIVVPGLRHSLLLAVPEPDGGWPSGASRCQAVGGSVSRNLQRETAR